MSMIKEQTLQLATSDSNEVIERIFSGFKLKGLKSRPRLVLIDGQMMAALSLDGREYLVVRLEHFKANGKWYASSLGLITPEELQLRQDPYRLGIKMMNRSQKLCPELLSIGVSNSFDVAFTAPYTPPALLKSRELAAEMTRRHPWTLEV